MCCLIFDTNSVRNISHSEKNSARYYHKCTQVLTWSTRYSGRILIKIEFSRQVFKKSSDNIFYWNPSRESGVVPCGQKDGRMEGWREGRTDRKRLTVVYRSFANTPKNWSAIPLYSRKSIPIHIQIFTVDRYLQIGDQPRLWPVDCTDKRSVLKLRFTLSYLLFMAF